MLRKIALVLFMTLLVVVSSPRSQAFAGGEENSVNVVSAEVVDGCRVERWEMPCRNGIKLIGKSCIPETASDWQACAESGCVQMSYQVPCKRPAWMLLAGIEL